MSGGQNPNGPTAGAAARGRLFQGLSHGRDITIGHADREEVLRLLGPIGPATERDELERWSFIAIRDPAGRGTDVHALGWRKRLDNSWITSAIKQISLAPGLIRTSSGHVYALGVADGQALAPELDEHLRYALRIWGISNLSELR